MLSSTWLVKIFGRKIAKKKNHQIHVLVGRRTDVLGNPNARRYELRSKIRFDRRRCSERRKREKAGKGQVEMCEGAKPDQRPHSKRITEASGRPTPTFWKKKISNRESNREKKRAEPISEPNP